MVVIVLPAYNEAARLEQLLERVASVMEAHEIAYAIVVVDDGSTDETPVIAARMAERLPLRLVSHHENRGYGRALGSGLETAVHDFEEAAVVVTLDADDSHGPELIPTLVAQVEAGYDLVVASRFAAGGAEVGVPAHRRLLSHAAGWVGRLLFRVPNVRDYTSGFRAYRSTLIRRLLDVDHGRAVPQEQGFAAGLELLLAAASMGARVGEVPLVLRYDRKRSESQFRLHRALPRYLRILLRHPSRRAASEASMPPLEQAPSETP